KAGRGWPKARRGAVHGKPPSLLRTHWDHEPLRLTEARSGPRVCDPQPARFMESLLSLLRTHWDHEPPLTRPSATLSPSDGEREGVRGRFMGKRAGDDQSERAVSGVTPTTSRLYPRGCQ